MHCRFFENMALSKELTDELKAEIYTPWLRKVPLFGGKTFGKLKIEELH
eukprot:SAG11_NODE_23733_length_384_cov_0.540351_2_plen_48_part_01